MSHYVDLPIDIHLLILRYLPPKDIASTRLTCKTVDEVTKTRAVWLDALKRTCLSYAIPFITYDFERMSREELEYAATGPDRFLHSGRRAMDSPSRTLHSVGERCRLPLSIQDPFFMRSRDDIVILPGGRFVLAYKGTLLLWDLSAVSDSAFVVMSDNDELFPGFKLCGVDVQSLVHYPAVSKIHLVVSAIKHDGQNGLAPALACVACELDLAVSPPRLSIARILLDATFQCFSGLGSRIIFSSSKSRGLFGLWDFEQDTAASWEWESSGQLNDPFLVTERHIFSHDESSNAIVVYDLPVLKPAEGIIPARSHTQAVQTIPLPQATYPLRLKVAGYNSSRNSDMIVIEADFIPSDGAQTGAQSFAYGQRSYVKRCIASSKAASTPFTMHETPVIYDHVFDRLPPKQSDGRVVSVYRRGYPCGEELWVHLSSIEDPTKGQAVCIGPREECFFPFPEGRTWGMHADYDICPVTGRLCVHRWDLGAIVVHDIMPSYVPVERK